MQSNKSLNEVLHSEERRAFLQTLNSFYDIFDFNVGFGEGTHPYIIYDVLNLPQTFYDSIRAFASLSWGTLMSATRLVASMDEVTLYDELSIPVDYYPQILGLQHLPPADVRFDIAVSQEAFESQQFSTSSFKLIEVNAATPSFFWETFEGNRMMCEQFSAINPNEAFLDVHIQDLHDYFQLHSKFPNEPIVFSFPFYGENNEDILCFDLRVGAYQQRYGERAASFTYLDNIVFNDEGAWLDNQRIYNLYLHLPSEWAINDTGVQKGTIDEASPWQILTEILLQNKLSKFPPISADILQNKSLLAFLFTQASENRFDPETATKVLQTIPPTFFYFEDAAENLEMFWEKPVYGREGCGVKLYDSDGDEYYNSYAQTFDDWDWYSNMPAIFQEHQPLPQLTYLDGTLELLFTVYVSPLGKPTGVACRANPIGEATTEAHGMWFPLGVNNEPTKI